MSDIVECYRVSCIPHESNAGATCIHACAQDAGSSGPGAADLDMRPVDRRARRTEPGVDAVGPNNSEQPLPGDLKTGERIVEIEEHARRQVPRRTPWNATSESQ